MDSPRSRRVQERSFEARDILSSFERDVLPVEYLSDIFQNIDHARSDHVQNPEFWTRQEDLKGTLLQHAAHSDEVLSALSRMQRHDMRVRLFREKISRRLKESFDKYDGLARALRERRVNLDTMISSNTTNGNHSGSRKVLEHLGLAGQSIVRISVAIQDQLQGYRNSLQKDDLDMQMAPILIEAIDDVCDRERDVMGNNRQPVGVNLFDIIFRDGNARENFMIRPLELLSDRTVRRMSSEIAKVRGRLMGMNRPRAVIEGYTNRLTGILQ